MKMLTCEIMIFALYFGIFPSCTSTRYEETKKYNFSSGDNAGLFLEGHLFLSFLNS